jgi:hypothetical protein
MYSGCAPRLSYFQPVSPGLPAGTTSPTPVVPPPSPATLTVGDVTARGARLTVGPRCQGASGQQCNGLLVETIRARLRRGRVVAVGRGQTTIGVGQTTRFSIQAGRSSVIALPANGAATRLLARFPRLPVTVTASQAGTPVGGARGTLTARRRRAHSTRTKRS